jgi:hypothetical protein
MQDLWPGLGSPITTSPGQADKSEAGGYQAGQASSDDGPWHGVELSWGWVEHQPDRAGRPGCHVEDVNGRPDVLVVELVRGRREAGEVDDVEAQDRAAIARGSGAAGAVDAIREARRVPLQAGTGPATNAKTERRPRHLWEPGRKGGRSGPRSKPIERITIPCCDRAFV